MGRLGLVLWVVLSTVMAGVGYASGKDCAIKLMPVELVPNNHGAILMKVKVGDQPAVFQLDTGASWSVIYESKVGDLPLRKEHINMRGFGNKTSDKGVNLPSLSIGVLTVQNMDMMVSPAGSGADDQVWGLIGENILKKFDLEINLAENKLNFVLPTGCGDRVVYWPHDAVAVLPFQRSRDHIVVYMTLDGKRVRTLFDTGAFASVLNLSTAEDTFGLKPGDPGVEDSGQATDVNGVRLPLYRHQFQKLEIDGLAFNHPWITMSSFRSLNIVSGISLDRNEKIERNDKIDFVLGLHQLRDLHIYVSYEDERIYLTKASLVETGNSTSPPAASVAVVPPTDSIDWQLIQPYLQKAETARREGNLNLAKTTLDDLVVRHPNYPQAYFYRAGVEAGLKDNDAAVADLDHAIELFQSYADAYRLRSQVRRAKGDGDGAQADLDMAIKLEPNSAASYQLRAEQRLRARDFDGAAADAAHMIEIDPKNSRAFSIRGGVYWQQKAYENALADYQQAAALDPKDAAVQDRLGELFYLLGRVDESVNSFARAIDLAPKVARYRSDRCWHLAMMKKLDDALADCNRGVELEPKFYPVLDSRGYVYLKLHQPKAAVADFDTALVINPKSAHSMYGRSLAKQELGDTKGAQADLAAAQQLQPDIAQHFPE